MKHLLATTMVVAAVGIISDSSDANAMVVQPSGPTYQTAHIQPVWWRGHRWGGWHRHYYHPWGWGYHPYRYHYWW